MLSPDDELDEMVSPDSLRLELEDLIQQGNRLRLERRRDLLTLRSKLRPLQDAYAKGRHDVVLPIYQEVIHESFQEESGAPYVTKIQAQLCSALHDQEVQQTQIKIAQRSNKRWIVYLSKQIEHLKEESDFRANKLTMELDKASNSNKVMKEMFEKDATDQEEEIKRLKLELGMDPNDFEPRRSFFAPRQRMKRLSGSLRNIMAHAVETPKILKESKIWRDLKDAEEKDEADMSLIRKSRLRILDRLKMPSLDRDSIPTFGNKKSFGGGGGTSSGSSSTPQQQQQAGSPFKTRSIFGSGTIPPPPPDVVSFSQRTSEKYEQLSQEVFDMEQQPVS